MSTFCEYHLLPWHTGSIKFWLGHQNLNSAKPLAYATLTQKASHINWLTTLDPPLILGASVSATHLAQGLGGLSTTLLRIYILPAAFLIALKNLSKPGLMHVACQFQTLTGLRAGQMSLLLPKHLETPGLIWMLPFKHQHHTQVLDISHVPTWLVTALLAFKSSDFTPILPYTKQQYLTHYKQLTGSFNLPHSSHASRHTFATIHRFLGDPLPRISQAMTHQGLKTINTYLHALSAEDEKIILQFPDYFQHLSIR